MSHALGFEIADQDFGTGTVCAEDEEMPTASDAEIRIASARMGVCCFVMRTSGLPFYASFRRVAGHLLARFGHVEISFFREIMTAKAGFSQ